MLDASAILAIDDRQLVSVIIPEWKTTVYVRPMSGTERDSFEAEMVGRDPSSRMANLRGRMAVRVVCNEKGERLFTDDQAAALGTKSAAALDRIFDVAQKASRLGDAGVTAAGKDSASGQSDASGSVSPSPSV
jgi:hypothetical protein